MKTLLQRTLRTMMAGLVTTGLLDAHAYAQSTTEYRIKAAYIFNFAKYVEWPAEEGKSTFRVCTAGRDDLGGALAVLEKRAAQGREIQVMRDVPAEQLRECQIVFVGESDNKLLAPTLRQLGSAPVLVVSDIPNAAESGAAINLLTGDDRVEFDVNLVALQRSNLRASSQMLKLARNTLPAKRK